MALFLYGKDPAGSKKIYVIAGLAGDPWVEVEVNNNSEAQLASQYGSALQLSDGSMATFKDRFTAPGQVTVTNPSGGGGAEFPAELVVDVSGTIRPAGATRAEHRR